MREKLIAHFKKREISCKSENFTRFSLVYFASYLLVFIIPKNILEISPIFKNFIYLFNNPKIPLFYNLINDPLYPDHIVFYVCMMSIVSIFAILKMAYDYFYHRAYEFGMFDIYPVKKEANKVVKNNSALKKAFSFMAMVILLSAMLWLFYFYGDFLNDHLRHNISISALFTTRFGSFFMMLFGRGC